MLVGLRTDREALDARIDASGRAGCSTPGWSTRPAGWSTLGLREGRTASRAVGYAQALAVIDGTATLEDAVADTALRTRRLVRRQESWFGADPRVAWFDPLEPDLLAERSCGRGAGSASSRRQPQWCAWLTG